MILLELIGPTLYKIKARIDEVEIGKIKVGQKAVVRIDAYPYQPQLATIKKIFPQPVLSEKTGIRTFEIELEFDSKETLNKITPKMQCSVEIKSIFKNVLKVQLEDVKEQEGKRYVFLVKDNKVKKQMIKTGLENEEEAEVLSGLQEGDKIIKNPSSEIQEGRKVNDKTTKGIKDI
ncbi:MAG: HlyD family efflux transporter periplasmic adaptor subunit [bacterium]